MASIERILKSPPKFESKLSFKAVSKLIGKDEGSKNTMKSNFPIIKKDSYMNRIVAFSAMCVANIFTVERTNALTNFYSKDFTYGEL